MNNSGRPVGTLRGAAMAASGVGVSADEALQKLMEGNKRFE